MTRHIRFLLGSASGLTAFDSYLPIAMGIKRERPEWDLRFYCFSRVQADYIGRNSIVAGALAGTASLETIDFTDNRNSPRRHFDFMAHAIRVDKDILRWSRPILMMPRPFTHGLYRHWRWLARLRGGHGILVADNRIPDQFRYVHRRNWERSRRKTKTPSKTADGIVHYHNEQELLLRKMQRNGVGGDLPRVAIGMPNLLPEWRKQVDADTAAEKARLEAKGIDTSEIYALFVKRLTPKKLRDEESSVLSYERIVETLKRLRPNATLIARPHPKAFLPSKRGTFDTSELGIELSFAHPESIASLARMCFYNGVSNVMFTTPTGRHVDCTDYDESHFEQLGETSLAQGFGVVYVNPRAADFEQRIEALLCDDAWSEERAPTRARETLFAQNPPRIDRLVDWLEAL